MPSPLKRAVRPGDPAGPAAVATGAASRGGGRRGVLVGVVTGLGRRRFAGFVLGRLVSGSILTTGVLCRSLVDRSLVDRSLVGRSLVDWSRVSNGLRLAT